MYSRHNWNCMDYLTWSSIARHIDYLKLYHAVITADARLCRGSKYVKALPDRGFLSNLIASDTGCGSNTSPWLVEARAGRRINVTLWDFATTTIERLTSDVKQQQQMSLGTVPGGGSCLKYATILEMDEQLQTQQNRPRVICSEYTRRRHVYTSTGSSLEIRIHGLPNDKKTGPYFLLEYQSRLFCVLLSTWISK